MQSEHSGRKLNSQRADAGIATLEPLETQFREAGRGWGTRGSFVAFLERGVHIEKEAAAGVTKGPPPDLPPPHSASLLLLPSPVFRLGLMYTLFTSYLDCVGSTGASRQDGTKGRKGRSHYSLQPTSPW